MRNSGCTTALLMLQSYDKVYQIIFFMRFYSSLFGVRFIPAAATQYTVYLPLVSTAFLGPSGKSFMAPETVLPVVLPATAGRGVWARAGRVWQSFRHTFTLVSGMCSCVRGDNLFSKQKRMQPATECRQKYPASRRVWPSICPHTLQKLKFNNGCS